MQTKGEYRVGISFNPSQKTTVDRIKQKAAELIDLIEDEVKIQAAHTTADAMKEGEVLRLKSLAMTDIERGAMWAVKAATKGSPE